VSPILAVVAYAMLTARYGPTHQSPRDRVHSYAVWDSVVFILNVLAFMLMGLQARGIIQRLYGRELGHAVAFAVGVFLITVIVRVAWVLTWRTLLRPLLRGFRDPTRRGSNARVRFLISWCGMRGILTLATAFALPAHFPGRDIIVLSAFTVVLGSLVVQGGTIGVLIKVLRIPPDTSLEKELAEVRVTLAEAGLGQLGDSKDPQTRSLRRQLTETLTGVQDDPDSELGADFDETRMLVTRAQREALNGLHDRGDLAEDVFQTLQEELDWRELSLAPRHEIVIDEG
jgi:NhaP-type Na+/H+ or K+/H+ antiporter